MGLTDVLWSELIEGRFDDDQPRDDHGRWTSGGDSGTKDWTITAIRPEVEDAKAILNRASQEFAMQGGTTKAVPDRAAAKEYLNNMEDQLEQLSEEEYDRKMTDTGEAMTSQALHAAAAYGLDKVSATVALAPNGDVAGAMLTSGVMPNPMGGQKYVTLDEDGNRVEHTYEDSAYFLEVVGSTHILDGVGSRFTQQAIQEAAKAGVGIALQPLDDNATNFWVGKLGMEKVAPGPTYVGDGGHDVYGRDYVGWTAAEVKYLAG